MSERTIVTLIPRDTSPTRPVGPATGQGSRLAPVITLPVAERTGRVIRPLAVGPAPRKGDDYRLEDVTGLYGYAPGPLARALMALADTDAP